MLKRLRQSVAANAMNREATCILVTTCRRLNFQLLDSAVLWSALLELLFIALISLSCDNQPRMEHATEEQKI
jgi:hypothetical protein